MKAAILRHQPAARPSVQKDNRLPFRIAALLVIDLVNVRDLQTTSVVGFDWRVKGSKFGHAAIITGVATLIPSQDLKSIPNLTLDNNLKSDYTSSQLAVLVNR